jgi:hypothetical protein
MKSVVHPEKVWKIAKNVFGSPSHFEPRSILIRLQQSKRAKYMSKKMPFIILSFLYNETQNLK